MSFAVLLFSFLFLLALYHYIRGRNEIFKRLGLTGPKGKFLFGNLSEIRDQCFPLVLQKWTREFGRIYGYMEGGRPVVVTSDLNMVQDIFVKRFSIFHARKIAPLVTDSIKELLELIDKQGNQSFDIYPLYQRMALDVIAKVAFGYETSIQQSENSQLYNLCKQLFKPNPLSDNIYLIAASVLPELTPLIKFLALTTGRFRGHPHVLITDNLRKLVKHLKSERNKGEETKRPANFIQMMLDAEAADGWDKETFADDDSHNTVQMLRVAKKLTSDEVVAQMLIILLAGYETTSTSLAFLTHSLAKYPSVQEKLQNEIDDHFRRQNRMIDYESVSQLSYLDMVVKESLRLYPNASSVVARRCMEPCKVGNYYVPKDMFLAADVWSIHYDENIWGVDAAQFRPERMAPEEQKNRHPMSWIPFGAGPRTCLGMRFALLEEKMVICHLLLNYNIVASDHTPDSLDLQGFVTVSPTNVYVKMEPRA